MSRTHAHAPLWVRIARRELAAEAHHVVGHDSCDLPERPPAIRPSWLPNTKYYWTFTYTGTNICSCAMCHAGWEARRVNRSNRHHDKVALCAALKQWRSGDDSALDDLPMPDRARFW